MVYFNVSYAVKFGIKLETFYIALFRCENFINSGGLFQCQNIHALEFRNA